MFGSLALRLGLQDPRAPFKGGGPLIAGTGVSGDTMTVTRPTTATSYQWYRDAVAISGATSATYVVQNEDASSTLSCLVDGVLSNGILARLYPAWVPLNQAGEAPQLFFDVAEGRGFFDGEVHTSTASLLTAVGGVASGTGYQIGPYDVPDAPEKFVNGGFDTDVTGWSPLTAGSCTLESVGGELRVTAPTGASVFAVGSFQGEANTSYRVTARSRMGSSITTQRQLFLSYNANLASAFNFDPAAKTGSPGFETHALECATAMAGAVYVGLRCGTANFQAGTQYWDSVSAKEIVPFKGFSKAGAHWVIDFTTSASAGVSEVIQTMDTLGRDGIVVARNPDSTLTVFVRRGNANVSYIEMGIVPSNTRLRLTIAYQTNGDLVCTLDSGGYYKAVGPVAVPTASVLRLGAQVGGASPWLGIQHSVSYWPSVTSILPDPLKSILVVGDSMPLTGAATVNNQFRNKLVGRWAPARNLATIANGGWASGTQLAQVVASGTAYKGWLTVILDRLNTGETVEAYVQNRKDIIAHLETDRFIIISPVRAAPNPGTGDEELMRQVAEIEKADYPVANYLDAHAYLDDPATRTDGIHMNDGAHAGLAIMVADKIVANGW